MKIYSFAVLTILFVLLFSCSEQPEYLEDKSSVSALVYGNNKFIAGFGWAKMSISNNGRDWTPINKPFKTYTTNALAYGNGVFVAGSISGAMAYSSDGEAWNLINNSPFGTSNIYSICYANDLFIAVGQNGIVANSDDGINWNKINQSTFEYYDDICTVIYSHEKFIIGGNKFDPYGKFLGSAFSYSVDGNIWQPINQINDNYVLSSVFGTDKYVTGYSRGQIKYSLNGLNWENSNVSCFGKNETIRSITFGEGKYLAVGGGGTIAYSNDGINWHKKNHNIETNGFLSTIYGNGIFLVGDWNGNITIFHISDF